MSTKKISALTELTTTPATGDLFPIVDISDTTDAASGTTKSIKPATVFLAAGIGAGNTVAEPVKINTSNGKVGIGTTAPSTQLQIYDSTDTSSSATATTSLSIDNYVGADLVRQKSFIEFNLRDDSDNGLPQVKIGAEVGQNADAGSNVTEGSGNFIIYTATGTGNTTNSLTEKVRVDFKGRVGIGSGTPEGQLEVEVADDANLVGLLVDQNDSTNNPYAISIENAGSGDSIRDDSGAKLTAAGVFTDASDQFNKKNISGLNVGLREVLKLIPKKFKYKKDNSAGVGFLAQDMEKIIPEVVHGNDIEIKDVMVREAVEAKAVVKNDKGEIMESAVEAQKAIIKKNKVVGGKSIAYGSLTAVLVKAIQELSAKVTALENA